MSQVVTPGEIEIQPDTLRRTARKNLYIKNMRMFLLVNFGLLLVAAGIHFFKVPNGFATGGVSGLSIIISHLFPTVPVGPMMGIINVLLLGVGFASIGRKFGAMTVYSSFALFGMVWVMDLAIPLAAPLTGDRMLGLFAKGFLIDLVIESINTRKQLVIICSRPNEVSAFITETLHRGATVHEGYGAYTHAPKRIITTVMTRRQAALLRRYVRELDPASFITITNTSEIIGKGFRMTD